MTKRILVLSVLSSLLAMSFASSALASHDVPIGATPIRVPLVTAFKACTSPDSTHGLPLNFPSCEPPVPVSSTVQAGTGSIGYAQILVCNVGSGTGACKEAAPGFTTGMQPDVRLGGEGRDVRCRQSGTPTGCVAGQDYNPSGAPGPYTTICGDPASCNTGNGGKASPFCSPQGAPQACLAGADITATAALGQPSGTTVNPVAQCGTDLTCIAFASNFAGHAIRVSDHYNCNPSAPGGDDNACPASQANSNRPATMIDLQFPVPVDCIVNPAGGDAGSNCGTNTTANALVPGSVIANKAAVVEVGEVQQLDSGPDGVRGNTDDQTFGAQGIFLP